MSKWRNKRNKKNFGVVAPKKFTSEARFAQAMQEIAATGSMVLPAAANACKEFDIILTARNNLRQEVRVLDDTIAVLKEQLHRARVDPKLAAEVAAATKVKMPAVKYAGKKPTKVPVGIEGAISASQHSKAETTRGGFSNAYGMSIGQKVHWEDPFEGELSGEVTIQSIHQGFLMVKQGPRCEAALPQELSKSKKQAS